MKPIYLLILLSFIIVGGMGCNAQSINKNCKDFTLGKWKLSYNPHYKKYAVVRYDSTQSYDNGLSFLAVDRWGRYGIYGEGWDDAECYECAIKSKSLFANSCEAKSFLLAYLRKIKDDHWE
jgi:hypothetical protein